MNAPEREALEIVDGLRFRGRYASETENEAGERRYKVAMRAADMIEALSASPAVTVTEGWQTMNSAPYNKTRVALISLRSDGSWKTGTGWYMPLTGWQDFDESPTHWAPLPKFDPAALKSTTPQTGSQE